MPDRKLPVSGLGFDDAFAQLEESLWLIRGKLGDERHQNLISMARQSKQLFADGKSKDARALLYDMKKALRKRR